MKWSAITMAVLLLGIGVAVADRSTNHGFAVGYYGELNKLIAAFKSLPGVTVESVGYNPDLTLEEISFQIKDSQVLRHINFGENAPIRELSGQELKAALASGLALAANYPKDSRLLERPAVLTPVCDYYPKPYGLWSPDVVEFAISLEEGLKDSSREAERLAKKYEFAYEFKGGGGKYYLTVTWLEPEQVAALRCEESVRGVGFRLLTIDVTSPVVSPNNSLQRP